MELLSVDRIKEELAVNASQFAQPLEALVVDNPESEKTAAELMVECRRRQATVEKTLEPHIKAAHASWKNLLELAKTLRAPYDAAYELLATKVGTYRRQVAEEQRRAQELALAEARKRAEEERLQAALAAEEAGAQAVAEAILNDPAPPPTVAPVVHEVETDSRVAFIRTYSAEVYDMKALVLAVAAGEVSMEALQPNQTWLNNAARVQKDFLKIPGVRAKASEHSRTQTKR